MPIISARYDYQTTHDSYSRARSQFENYNSLLYLTRPIPRKDYKRYSATYLFNNYL
jgi:hypothetical protein